MKTNKTKLLQDIEAMKEKLASLEEELSTSEEFRHFPSDEADEAYNKAVALEKIKRRIIELQGDWKPNWKDIDERKAYIRYCHHTCIFEVSVVFFLQIFQALPYMKSPEISEIIIEEMEDELKLLFDIA